MNEMIGIMLAVAAVLLAIILLFVALRYWMRERAAEGRRIGVIERHAISRDAELVLVRRDGAQHLICLNGNGGFLVEAGIGKAASEPASPPQATATPMTAAAPAQPVVAPPPGSSSATPAGRAPAPATAPAHGTAAPAASPSPKAQPAPAAPLRPAPKQPAQAAPPAAGKTEPAPAPARPPADKDGG